MEYVDGPSGQERCLGSSLMIIIAYQAIGVEKTVFGEHFQGSRQMVRNTLQTVRSGFKEFENGFLVFALEQKQKKCQILMGGSTFRKFRDFLGLFCCSVKITVLPPPSFRPKIVEGG